MRKVVVNSTPLISLYKINKLNLLKEIYGSIYVPYGVYEELSIKDKYNFLNEKQESFSKQVSIREKLK